MFEYLQGLSEWWALLPIVLVSLAIIILERYQDQRNRNRRKK